MRRNRQDAIGKRKDARLAAVIITERYDKKAAKYATPSVPFPFGSKDVYERSIRQPLGRDFNTDSSFRCAHIPSPHKHPVRMSFQGEYCMKEDPFRISLVLQLTLVRIAYPGGVDEKCCCTPSIPAGPMQKMSTFIHPFLPGQHSVCFGTASCGAVANCGVRKARGGIG